MPRNFTHREVGTNTKRSRKRERVVGRSVAVAKDMAEEFQDWIDLGDLSPRFDLDDGPEDDAFPSLPLDDDDLGEDEVELPLASRRSVSASLRIQLDPWGSPEVVVTGPDPARLDVDPEVRVQLVNRHHRLQLVGDALTKVLPGPAIGASDMASLYNALDVMTQREIAKSAGIEPAALSRDNALLVGLQSVVVPLELFFWRSSADELVVRLLGWGGLREAWGTDTVRLAQGYLGDSVSDDTVRNLLTWLKPLAAEPWLAVSYHAHFRNAPYAADRLLGELAEHARRAAKERGLPAPKERRGAAVLRRAIVGGLPLWH